MMKSTALDAAVKLSAFSYQKLYSSSNLKEKIYISDLELQGLSLAFFISFNKINSILCILE
jgi:hypothetical protein